MKKYLFAHIHVVYISFFFWAATAHSSWYMDAGPHFSYTRMNFDNPSHLSGYTGGVTAEIGNHYKYFFSNLEFEGTWNAGPFTGTPCQMSSLTEYFLELKLGGSFSRCKRIYFDPYTGFGWDRFENEQDPDTAALLYRYDKLFIPVGFYLYGVLDCNMKLGVQFEWRPDVFSRLEIISIHLHNKCENGFKVQLPFEWTNYCQTWFFKVIPFFDWNEFGEVQETNSVGVPLDIPDLVRWYAGLRFLAGYKF